MNVSGVIVTIRKMLDALKTVGDDKVLKLVKKKNDEATEKIIWNWSTQVDISRAKALGFEEYGNLSNTLQEYVDDYGTKIS